MQTPFWVGLTVHLASSAAYPVYYLIRRPIQNQDLEDANFARKWMTAMAIFSSLLGILTVLGESGREVPWPFTGKQKLKFD